MKSLLLNREDYMKMRKMGTNEMTRFLEEREYKKEIDALSAEHKGMELINLALNQSLSNTINKLIMISTKEAHELIRNYSMKWIVGNIKILLRSDDWELAKKAIVPIEPTTYKYCINLMLAKKEKDKFIKEICSIAGVDFENFNKLYEGNDIISMENELDKSYYSRLLSVYRYLESGILKNFYKSLVELTDIKNVMKLKSMNVPEESIRNLVMTKSVLVNALIRSDRESAIKLLKDSKYAGFAEGIETDLTNLENNVEKYLLQYSFRLVRLKPLSLAPIFGYLLAKEIEIRNIRLLINSRAVGLEEEFVEKNLIV
jgi:V/A-type H+-transporting ATPase subunit C